tara:strand:- start:234 stop:344 length:111 start_codon:yes stop_codon:yes gene_type:complete
MIVRFQITEAGFSVNDTLLCSLFQSYGLAFGYGGGA